MADDLNGADYRAVRRLSTGDDETLAEVGATCERVPAMSLAWLLAEGAIVPVQAATGETPADAWADLGRPDDARDDVDRRDD